MTEIIVPIVPISSGEGNTTTSPTQPIIKKKQISPSKRWCFTLNNYTQEDFDNIILTCSSNSSKYIVGKEVGESGTPHLQGYFEYYRKIRPLSLKLSDKIHWERAKGTKSQNITYCSKDGDFYTNFTIPKPIKTLDEKQLYVWQSNTLDTIKGEADERKIHWIWDSNGNMGKSAFCKFLAIKFQALMVDGKGNDIMQAIAGFKELEQDYPKIIIVDCPRHNFEYVNYGAIEKVKNGHVFSGKYESKQLVFNIPHVIVFANNPPDMTKWSIDRYDVIELKESDKKIKE